MQSINIRNNMIVDNVAADIGGGIMLDDASRVSIINNTVANNYTTGSSENSAIGVPHAAGLASEVNDPLWQAALGPARVDSVGTRTGSNSTLVLDPAITAADLGKNVSGPRIQAGAMILSVTPGVSFLMSRPTTSGGGFQNNVALTIAPPNFANPIALFNNIFWDNDALTLDQFGPGATLVDQGFIDFEVHGTTNNTDTFTPRFSDLTNGLILGPDGVLRPVPPGQGNQSGDPGFIAPFLLELAVSGSRLDPQQAAVTITGQDPPVGLTGDYHLNLTTPVTGGAANNGSFVVDRGARCSNTPFPGPNTGVCAGGGIQAPLGVTSTINPTGGDYDRQVRPTARTGRTGTPWDAGADELPGNSVTLTGVPPGFMPATGRNHGLPAADPERLTYVIQPTRGHGSTGAMPSPGREIL